MKKTLKLFASVMAFAILTSCGAPTQPQSVKANQDPLVVVGNKVDADITGTFPVKSFAKKASAYGTEAYLELANAKKEFPNYRLVIKTTKSKNIFKGMDENFMENYISNHDDKNEIIAEFNKLRESNLPLGELKQWFFEVYPTFKNCKTRAEWIIAA